MRPTALLPVLPILIAACGPSTPEAAAPAATATPAASAEPAAPASAAPSAAPAASAEPNTVVPAKPSADVDGPDGIRRMAVWEGPKTVTAVTTKRAWVFGPNTIGDKGLSFSSIALRLVDVEKADGNELIFKQRTARYAVPAALASAASPGRGLKKGAPVLCSFGGGAVAGRVDAVDAKGVTCALRFMGKLRKEKVDLDEVRPLSGKLEPGAPALVRFEGEEARYTGVVVAASGDDVWVTVATQFVCAGDPRAGRAVHKVKAAGVEVIDLSKPLKPGDACSATQIADVQPCKVAKVLDGGLAYVVTFESGSAGGHDEWSLDVVGGPAKGAKK